MLIEFLLILFSKLAATVGMDHERVCSFQTFSNSVLMIIFLSHPTLHRSVIKNSRAYITTLHTTRTYILMCTGPKAMYPKIRPSEPLGRSVDEFV
jgi:hypothetical protein